MKKVAYQLPAPYDNWRVVFIDDGVGEGYMIEHSPTLSWNGPTELMSLSHLESIFRLIFKYYESKVA